MELAMLALKYRSIYFPILVSLFLYLALPSVVYAQTKTTTYTYDALGRLTFVEDSQNGNRDYDYDKAGNRLLVSTSIVNDAAAEPDLPAPTGLSYNTHWGNGYDVRWTPVTGATYYRLTFGSQTNYTVQGGSSNQFSTGANTSANRPNYIVACNASVCSAKAYF
jgi:YD repeat-containing protein